MYNLPKGSRTVTRLIALGLNQVRDKQRTACGQPSHDRFEQTSLLFS